MNARGGRGTATPAYMLQTTTGAPVMVLPDVESLALAVATSVVVEARRAVKRSGRFAIALSGGSTPERAYRLLAERPFAGQMPWASTHVFWGDERCVDPGDRRSNERMAREALLDHVPIPEAHVHPMRCVPPASGGAQRGDLTSRLARDAAGRYDKLLRAQGSVPDLVLLGLGEDGHTASLFPGSAALQDAERWAVPALQGSPGSAGSSGGVEPLWRVTLTPACINQAGAVFFVVSGAGKAAIVKAVVADEADHGRSPGGALPARLIRPVNGVLCWFLDEPAASQLREHGGA